MVYSTFFLFTVGTKFPASSLKEQEVRAYREIERQNMHETLDDYLLICQRMGVIIVVILYVYEFQNLFNFLLIFF